MVHSTFLPDLFLTYHSSSRSADGFELTHKQTTAHSRIDLRCPIWSCPHSHYPASCPYPSSFIRCQPTRALPSPAKFGADTISLCTPSDPHGVLYTCDVPFITRLCSFAAREAWPRLVEEYGVLSYFGGRVVISKGKGWRRLKNEVWSPP